MNTLVFYNIIDTCSPEEMRDLWTNGGYSLQNVGTEFFRIQFPAYVNAADLCRQFIRAKIVRFNKKTVEGFCTVNFCRCVPRYILDNTVLYDVCIKSDIGLKPVYIAILFLEESGVTPENIFELGGITR